jgi:hypothetical protein
MNLNPLVPVVALSLGLIPVLRAEPRTPTPAAAAPHAENVRPDPGEKPLVQVALLLDTSNSMDGLIQQAKTQLWRIVQELGSARRNGKAPRLEVALYEYGNTGLKSDEGWIRRVLPFTDDLDQLSERLFALRTSGGDEFCGWVIRNAVDELDWSPSPDVYRAIFIAGNEPFNQGPVTPASASRKAAARGIIVNTIHCGTDAAGREGGWNTGAALTDGRYMIIDKDAAVADVAAPQDRLIAELNVKLNATYVPYGRAGKDSLARQSEQDQNAASLADAPSAGSRRAAVKASAHYRNAAWDLVDAVTEKKVDVKQVPATELPAAMQEMKPEARQAFVEQKQKDRAEIQSQIRQLSAERERHVAAQLKHQTTNTLDHALIGAVRSQVTRQGYTFTAP